MRIYNKLIAIFAIMILFLTGCNRKAKVIHEDARVSLDNSQQDAVEKESDEYMDIYSDTDDIFFLDWTKIVMSTDITLGKTKIETDLFNQYIYPGFSYIKRIYYGLDYSEYCDGMVVCDYTDDYPGGWKYSRFFYDDKGRIVRHCQADNYDCNKFDSDGTDFIYKKNKNTGELVVWEIDRYDNRPFKEVHEKRIENKIFMTLFLSNDSKDMRRISDVMKIKSVEGVAFLNENEKVERIELKSYSSDTRTLYEETVIQYEYSEDKLVSITKKVRKYNSTEFKDTEIYKYSYVPELKYEHIKFNLPDLDKIVMDMELIYREKDSFNNFIGGKCIDKLSNFESDFQKKVVY